MLEKEHASTHNRHSNTVDQLTDDKRALEERVANLMRLHDDDTARLKGAQEELRKHSSALDEKNKLHLASKRELEGKIGNFSIHIC